MKATYIAIFATSFATSFSSFATVRSSYNTVLQHIPTKIDLKVVTSIGSFLF